MKKMTMAICILMTSLSANALTLNCINKGSKLAITVNDSANTIQIKEQGKHTYDFTVYDKSSYEVSEGTVASYSIKDGVDASGFSLSGELAILNGKNVALELLNDSLGKSVVRIENMKCK